jgi:hypothetical protein
MTLKETAMTTKTTNTTTAPKTTAALEQRLSRRQNLDTRIARVLDGRSGRFTQSDVLHSLEAQRCGGPVSVDNVRRILRRRLYNGQIQVVDVDGQAYVYEVAG